MLHGIFASGHYLGVTGGLLGGYLGVFDLLCLVLHGREVSLQAPVRSDNDVAHAPRD